jgi:tRNA(fMet)-specific endonuclease VapC
LCTSWSMLPADARAAGRSLSPQDAWIAATALGLNAKLAANNRSDFEHVHKLQLISP